jgi:putative transcriptional regulator
MDEVRQSAYISAMTDQKLVRCRLDPANPPKADWSRFDAMTEDERHAAALADPDAQPATDDQLSRMRRVPDVAAIRAKFGLTIEQFGARFGLSPVLLRQWEDGTRWPDPAAQMLLRVIEREPEAVARVAAG